MTFLLMSNVEHTHTYLFLIFRYKVLSAASKSAHLLSKVPHSAHIECLSDPLSQSWVTGACRTLFIIQTTDASGALWTYPHQHIIQTKGWASGHPTLNNAHQLCGSCISKRVDESGVVGCPGGVFVAEKYSWPQERWG